MPAPSSIGHNLVFLHTLISLVVWYLVVKSCLTLGEPRLEPLQAPLSMGFPRPEYWSGLPFPSPGDLPDPGIKPTASALQADSLPLSHLGSL